MGYYRKFFILSLIVISGFFSCSVSLAGTVNLTSEVTIVPGGEENNGVGRTPVVPSIGKGKVIFKGVAYPEAQVNLLQESALVASQSTNSLGQFTVEIDNLAEGVYTFSLQVQQVTGYKSLITSYTFNVIADTVTTISTIVLPPTLELTQNSLNLGEFLPVVGRAAPLSRVVIGLDDQDAFAEVVADQSGNWQYLLDSKALSLGEHGLKAKMGIADGNFSIYCEEQKFILSAEGEPIPEVLGPTKRTADFNNDGKVDLVDFSILLYYWSRASELTDIDKSGIVDLVDFSILLYEWTG